MRVQVSAAVFRPLRLNFAQVCIWCERRWCDSAECVAKHEQSLWGVCDVCEGTMELPDTMESCRCVFGVVEATPRHAAASVAVYGTPESRLVLAAVNAR
jgi:hypothetical protein